MGDVKLGRRLESRILAVLGLPRRHLQKNSVVNDHCRHLPIKFPGNVKDCQGKLVRYARACYKYKDCVYEGRFLPVNYYDKAKFVSTVQKFYGRPVDLHNVSACKVFSDLMASVESLEGFQIPDFHFH